MTSNPTVAPLVTSVVACVIKACKAADALPEVARLIPPLGALLQQATLEGPHRIIEVEALLHDIIKHPTPRRH